MAGMGLDLAQIDFFLEVGAAVTQHSVRFSGSRLPVHEHGSVYSIEGREDDVAARLRVDLLVALTLVEAAILHRLATRSARVCKGYLL